MRIRPRVRPAGPLANGQCALRQNFSLIAPAGGLVKLSQRLQVLHLVVRGIRDALDGCQRLLVAGLSQRVLILQAINVGQVALPPGHFQRIRSGRRLDDV